MIVGYARVSTDGQTLDAQNIYLGEMTFSPARAHNSFPSELQAHLGNLWSQGH